MNSLEEVRYDRLYKQAHFALENVPFYQAALKQTGLIKVSRKNYLELLSTLPSLTKTEVLNIHPYELLPRRACLHDPIIISRWTGGTTGTPLPIFYSKKDWQTARDIHAKIFKRLIGLSIGAANIFNSYNQAHISGPIFSESATLAGATVISRPPHEDDAAAVRLMKRLKCNFIVCPPTAEKKGGTLIGLLEADANTGINYINGNNIIGVIVSSSTLEKTLLAELSALGIKNVINCYGSTEIMSLGFSCPHNAILFHLCDDSAVTLVVDDNNQQVRNETRGRVLSSRLGVQNLHGWSPSRSTNLLSYYNGDSAIYVREACRCGFNGESLAEPMRANFKENNLLGCQSL